VGSKGWRRAGKKAAGMRPIGWANHQWGIKHPIDGGFTV